MLEMVTEGKMSRAAGNTRHDLFSKLLDASESDLTGEKKLTELEVISNIFIFLFAGKYLNSLFMLSNIQSSYSPQDTR